MAASKKSNGSKRSKDKPNLKSKVRKRKSNYYSRKSRKSIKVKKNVKIIESFDLPSVSLINFPVELYVNRNYAEAEKAMAYLEKKLKQKKEETPVIKTEVKETTSRRLRPRRIINEVVSKTGRLNDITNVTRVKTEKKEFEPVVNLWKFETKVYNKENIYGYKPELLRNPMFKNESNVNVKKYDDKKVKKEIIELAESSMLTRTRARILAEQDLQLNFSQLSDDDKPKRGRKKMDSSKVKVEKVTKKKNVKNSRKRKVSEIELKVEDTKEFIDKSLMNKSGDINDSKIEITKKNSRKRKSELKIEEAKEVIENSMIKSEDENIDNSVDAVEAIKEEFVEVSDEEKKNKTDLFDNTIIGDDDELKVDKSLCEIFSNSLESVSHPVYLKKPMPLLPTFDCYDSDDENAPYSRKEKPDWLTREYLHKSARTASFIDPNFKNTLFSVQPITPDLQEIFVKIDPKKLSRNSSAIWTNKPSYTPAPIFPRKKN